MNIPKISYTRFFPKLTDRLPSRCLTRREETALSRFHTAHSHVVTYLLLLNEEDEINVPMALSVFLDHWGGMGPT